MHRLLICCLATALLFTSPAQAASGLNLGGGYSCSGNTIVGRGNRPVKLSTAKQAMSGKITELKARVKTAKNKGQTGKVNSLSQKVTDAKTTKSLLKQCTDGKLDSGQGPTGPGKPGKPVKPSRPSR